MTPEPPAPPPAPATPCLTPGHGYILSNLRAVIWDNLHPRFGCPDSLAVVYLGSLQGTRLWHLWEVRIAQADAGVLMLNAADLAQITVTPL